MKKNILMIINKSYLAKQNSLEYKIFQEKLDNFEKNRKFDHYNAEDIKLLKHYKAVIS